MAPTVKLTLWRLLDGFICIFVLAPLVVFYWRGSFQVLDIYTYPSDLALSSWINVVIGIVGTVAVNLLQGFLHTRVNRIKVPALQLAIKRLYTYIFGWIIVNHWRGIWRLWDAYTGAAYTGTVVWSGLTSFLVGCGILLALKSFRNLVAPPLVTVSDFDANYFIIKTRFRTKAAASWQHLLDTVFSVAIPGSLVISVWRGQWAILDYLLETDFTKTTSYLISAAVGFGLTVLLFFLQWPAAALSRNLERRGWNWVKLAFEDCFYYLACFAAVNIWRSVWGLCDVYILPDNYPLSNWVCHLAGAFGSMLLLHGNSVLVRDVQIDGEYKEGKGLFFFSKSLTLFEQRSGLFPDSIDHQITETKENHNGGLPTTVSPTRDAITDLEKHALYNGPANVTSSQVQEEESERMLQEKLDAPVDPHQLAI